MTKRKVVHISRGYEDYVISLANQLAAYVDLHLVLAAADEWITPMLDSRVNVIATGAPRVSSTGNLKSMAKLARIVHKISPDIIHYQSGVIWESLAPSWLTGARVITTVHDVVHHPHQLRNQFTPQLLIDRLAKRSDVLIVHGECLRQQARRRYFEDRSTNARPIATIAHPTILRYGQHQARPQPGRNILLFGGLAQWKGIEVLLPAMQLLLQRLPDAQLKIAGPSSMPDYYRSLDPGHANIQFDIRRQSDDDVRALFTWADVLALPYIEASQSGVLHIAQSFSLPVVATRVGALAESIEDGINGLLIPPNDTQALSDALFDVLTNAPLRKKIIATMTSKRDEEVSRQSIGAQTAALYETTLKPLHRVS